MTRCQPGPDARGGHDKGRRPGSIFRGATKKQLLQRKPSSSPFKSEGSTLCLNSSKKVLSWSGLNCWRSFRISVLASKSQRSFISWPACPLSHFHVIWCLDDSTSSSFQSCSFLTGFLSFVFHPRTFQSFSHSEIPFRTYCESVKNSTSQGSFSAFSPSTAA